MGHYAGEMQCERCGCGYCVCPPRPQPVKYMLDERFDIVPSHRVNLLSRLDKPQYDSVEQARAARAAAIETAIGRTVQSALDTMQRQRERINDLRAAREREPEVLP